MTRRPLLNLLRKRKAERETRQGEDFTRPLIGLVAMVIVGAVVLLVWGGSP